MIRTTVPWKCEQRTWTPTKCCCTPSTTRSSPTTSGTSCRYSSTSASSTDPTSASSPSSTGNYATTYSAISMLQPAFPPTSYLPSILLFLIYTTHISITTIINITICSRTYQRITSTPSLQPLPPPHAASHSEPIELELIPMPLLVADKSEKGNSNEEGGGGGSRGERGGGSCVEDRSKNDVSLFLLNRNCDRAQDKSTLQLLIGGSQLLPLEEDAWLSLAGPARASPSTYSTPTPTPRDHRAPLLQPPRRGAATSEVQLSLPAPFRRARRRAAARG